MTEEWWTDKIKKFGAIRKASEEALEKFKKANIDDTYNHGDLRIADVAFCYHEDGDHEWAVTIEEADPRAYKLQEFIITNLRRRNIAARVITEW